MEILFKNVIKTCHALEMKDGDIGHIIQSSDSDHLGKIVQKYVVYGKTPDQDDELTKYVVLDSEEGEVFFKLHLLAPNQSEIEILGPGTTLEL